MDPYRDVIPDDCGEGIRELVTKRDDSESGELARKRPRAQTLDLLPLGGDLQEIEIEIPKPEDDLDKPTKQKITPRTLEFLKLHKEAYKAAIDAEAPEKASRAVVQAMDHVYHSAAFSFKPRKPEEHEHLMHYVKLRRLELLANYGNYLGVELQENWADLEAAATTNTGVEMREAALESGPPETGLTMADELARTNMDDLRENVDVACGILGIDPDHVLWLIKEWTERNRTFHNQTREHISNCHWGRLANQVCRDLKELFKVAPNSDMAVGYEKVLLGTRDEYFLVDDITPDDPEYWFPNGRAWQMTEETIGRW